MTYVYIGIGVVLVAVVIYFILKRKPAIPHEVEEAVSTDIFKKIPLKDVQENKSIIIGIDQSFVLFENMKIVYTHDGYRVNYKDVLPYTKLNKTKHDPGENYTVNQYNAFKIQTGIIRDIEVDNKQPVQFFDNFYNVLIKLTMDIRLSCKVANKTKFLSNVGGFKDIMTKKEFASIISKSVGSKIYAYLSSFVVDKGVSYLHMSLHKHDIEEYMIYEFNIDLEPLGIELTSIELKNIEFEDEPEFKEFEANLLEKARMNILDYSYEDKMNKDILYHEDIEGIYDVENNNIKVKI